jgi:AraC-like DNA-binding protein
MLNVDKTDASLEIPTRSIPNLTAALAERDGRIRTPDGWRQPMLASRGYRHIYDDSIAKGGFEFYALRPGLWLLMVDMRACSTLPRRHSFGDKLVCSAVLNGDIGINGPSGAEGELVNGYCTVYGMKDGAFDTIYDPGDTLKWVSVIVDRERLTETLNLDPEEMPDCVRDFVVNGRVVPYRNVLLSGAASLAATQILACRFQGSSRAAFLTAKALELSCLCLFSLRDEHADELDNVALTDQESVKVERARRAIERSLDTPPAIEELAESVGLTRQRLQQGFRQLYDTTVGQIRDKLRIEHALHLIRNTQMPMIDIGMEVGYEHPASFTRAFKAAYGISPIQMRRMAKQETARATSSTTSRHA